MTGEPPTAYRPGACNIGTEEIARRRRLSRILIGLVLLVAAALLVVGVSAAIRAIVVVPLAAGIVTELEVRRRFCVAFATLGLRSFGSRSQIERVQDAAARRTDRLAAVRLILAGVAIAIAITAAFVLVPI